MSHTSPWESSTAPKGAPPNTGPPLTTALGGPGDRPQMDPGALLSAALLTQLLPHLRSKKLFLHEMHRTWPWFCNRLRLNKKGEGGFLGLKKGPRIKVTSSGSFLPPLALRSLQTPAENTHRLGGGGLGRQSLGAPSLNKPLEKCRRKPGPSQGWGAAQVGDGTGEVGEITQSCSFFPQCLAGNRCQERSGLRIDPQLQHPRPS